MTSMLAIALLTGVLGSDSAESEAIEVEAVLTLVEEIEVPAREAGVLSRIMVRPSSKVAAGGFLGQVDDSRAHLLRDQARINLNNARRLAGNDLQVQLAKKTREVAQNELRRALEAAEQFAKSVSESELDRLRLEADRASLQILQSEFDLDSARAAVLAEEAALKLAEHDIANRRIIAPCAGVVVEVLRRTGEWVEPGQPVARMVRMDRLRVEGFLPARQAMPTLEGREVSVTIHIGADRDETVVGVLSFVSPEIHPVNGMVRVWAEIENSESAYRPGLPATMSIQP